MPPQRSSDPRMFRPPYRPSKRILFGTPEAVDPWLKSCELQDWEQRGLVTQCD